MSLVVDYQHQRTLVHVPAARYSTFPCDHSVTLLHVSVWERHRQSSSHSSGMRFHAHDFSVFSFGWVLQPKLAAINRFSSWKTSKQCPLFGQIYSCLCCRRGTKLMTNLTARWAWSVSSSVRADEKATFLSSASALLLRKFAFTFGRFLSCSVGVFSELSWKSLNWAETEWLKLKRIFRVWRAAALFWSVVGGCAAFLLWFRNSGWLWIRISDFWATPAFFLSGKSCGHQQPRRFHTGFSLC